MSNLIYKVDACYASDDGTHGVNPLKLRFEVYRTGEIDLYHEIAVDCFDSDDNMVGSVYIGLCQNKKDMRVLLTTDGNGEGDQTVAVYPMRPHDEAVDTEWNG